MKFITYLGYEILKKRPTYELFKRKEKTQKNIIKCTNMHTHTHTHTHIIIVLPYNNEFLCSVVFINVIFLFAFSLIFNL